MGFLDRLLRRRKHARGNPSEEDTDPRSHTVLIQRGDPRVARESDPWGDPEDRDPFEAAEVANSEAPTELRTPHEVGRRVVAERPGMPNDVTLFESTLEAVRTGRLLGVLVATDGPVEGFVARVVEGKNILGRDGYPDPIPKREETRGISRHHATLEAANGGFVIEPGSDRNAVFVNEHLIDQRTLLNHGDRIRLGNKQPLTLVLLVVP